MSTPARTRARRLAALQVSLGVVAALGMVETAAATVSPAVDRSAVESVQDFTAVPLHGFGDVIVDEQRERVYISGGRGDSRIAVVSFDGSQVFMVTDVPGATDLAMNEDGSALYAALPTADAVAEVDLAQLTARRIPTGTGSCPSSIAPVAGRVWFTGYSCNSHWGLARAVNPATGELTRFDVYANRVTAVPHTQNVIVADGSSLELRDAETASLVTSRGINGALVGVTADGARAVVQDYREVAFFRTDDLAADGALAVEGNQPVAVDGDLVASARSTFDTRPPRVKVLDRRTGTLLNTVAYGQGFETAYGVAGLALAASRLVTVTGESRSGPLRVYQSAAPEAPAPRLEMTAPEAPYYFGAPVTVQGTLSSADMAIDGVPVTVRDQDGTVQGTVTTDAAGHWELTVDLKRERTWLIATSAGDPGRKAAWAMLFLQTTPRPTDLVVSGPGEVAPRQPATFTGRLTTAEGTPLRGETIEVLRVCNDSGYGWIIDEVLTGADGQFEVTDDDPGRCSVYQYRFDFVGDQRLARDVAWEEISVGWHLSSLSVSAPSAVKVGDDIRISGQLSIDQAPAAGKAVEVRVYRPYQPAVVVHTLVTDENGAFEFTEPTETVENRYYSIWYAGDETTLDARNDLTIPVSTVAAGISLLTAEPRVALDQEVVISGQLTREDDAPLGDLRITVMRTAAGGWRSLSDVRTSSDGSFVIRDVTDEGGSVTYQASYGGQSPRYAPTTSKLTIQVPKVGTALSLQPDAQRVQGGDPVVLRGQLTRYDDRPVGGVDLLVSRGAVTLPPVTTAPDGTFRITDTDPPWYGTTYVVRHPGTARYEASAAQATVEFDIVPTSLALTPEQTQVTYGDDVVLNGTLAAPDQRPFESATVDVYWKDTSGETRVTKVDVLPDGTFTARFPAPPPGEARYGAYYAGSRRYAWSTADTAVTVVKRAPVIKMTFDRGAYTAGQQATIQVFPGLTGGRVEVHATDVTGRHLLYSGHTSLSPPVIHYVLNRTTQFTVTTEETTTTEPGSLTKTPVVRLALQTRDYGAYHLRNSLRLYHVEQDPVFVTTVRPHRAFTCLRYVTQRQARTSWVTVKTSRCLAADEADRVGYAFTGPREVGDTFRTRAEFAGDREHAATDGDWTRFRFTN